MISLALCDCFCVCVSNVFVFDVFAIVICVILLELSVKAIERFLRPKSTCFVSFCHRVLSFVVIYKRCSYLYTSDFTWMKEKFLSKSMQKSSKQSDSAGREAAAWT